MITTTEERSYRSAADDKSARSQAVPRSTSQIVLRVIRAAQPISRVVLAKRVGVSRGSITGIVNPLIDQGVLREGKPEQPLLVRAGRPPVGLWLRGEGAFFIGVNIGVRETHVGAETAEGEGLAEERFNTLPDSTLALEKTARAIEQVCAKVSNRKLATVGVSMPGPVDSERSKLLYAPHLGWSDVPVVQILRDHINSGKRDTNDIPIVVENDAIAAAVYEAQRKLRVSTSSSGEDFVLVRAGTGIGVGVVRGGEVYRGIGIGGLVGEYGHMTIVADGKQCVCGNRGCWERYASSKSAGVLYAESRPDFKTDEPPRFREVVDSAEAGDKHAKRTLEQIGNYLGIGISNVISGLGINTVVVSGRVVYGWRFIAEPLRQAIARTMVGRLTNWSVEPGSASGGGLGGAIEVAVEQYLINLAK